MFVKCFFKNIEKIILEPSKKELDFKKYVKI